MMEMSKHSDVPYHLWKVHHIHEEPGVQQRKFGEKRRCSRALIDPPFVIARFRQALFLDCPLANFDGLNNWFREWLRVFFLDHSLNVFSIDLLCCGVVLLFLMQNYLISWYIIYFVCAR